MIRRIAEQPLPLVYKEIIANSISGELTVKGNSFSKYLYFTGGRLTFARTTLVHERLGDILLQLGKIDQGQHHTLQQLIESSREKLGVALVQHQILNQKDLFAALVTQLRTIASSTFSLTLGEWEFKQGNPDIPEDSRFNIELAYIIAEGVRYLPNISFYQNRFMNRTPLTKEIRKSVHHCLSQTDEKFYHTLSTQDNLTCQDIMPRMGLSSEIFWKRVVKLYLLDIIDFGITAPDQPAAGNIARLREIHEKLKSSRLTHYELLELPTTATAAEIRQRYFDYAKRYHPDRLGGSNDPEIQACANQVFASINRAYEVLSDEGKRRNYDAGGYADHGGEGIQQEDPKERARKLYLKGKGLYGQKKFWEAAMLLADAVRLDQGKASYYYLLGLSQMQIPSQKKAAETSLKRVTQLEPWNAEPYTALGLLFISERMVQRAQGYFQRALTIDPGNLLARNKLAEIFGHSKRNRGRFSLFGKKKDG